MPTGDVVIVVRVHGPQPFVYTGFESKLQATTWAVENLQGYTYAIVRSMPAKPTH